MITKPIIVGGNHRAKWTNKEYATAISLSTPRVIRVREPKKSKGPQLPADDGIIPARFTIDVKTIITDISSKVESKNMFKLNPKEIM